MPRVRWCPLPVLCLLYVYSSWINPLPVQADCWYDDERHDEGTEVATAEPCLNCTCSRSVLLCYLRVCPKLPNPPPQGCILLHRYRTCCPELICTDMPNGGNKLEARSEPGVGLLLDNEVPFDRTIRTTACIANGSVYGPGSAMDSSTMCEYCYCLGGQQTCVKPKCLLPLDGCTPLYEETSCCPVHYNCTKRPQLTTKLTSTTQLPHQKDRDGCLVDNIMYPEGGKILGVGHSVCDNCYCLRGLLRCEPLSCAPPLLGCTPVIKQGECCAASYNCSGTIEIQAIPNYGQYPIVSKDYAKLRKQAQHNIISKLSHATTIKVNQRSSFGTTRQFSGNIFNPSTNKPSSKEKDSQILYINSKTADQTTSETVPDANLIPNEEYRTMEPTPQSSTSNDYLEFNDYSILSLFDSLLSDKFEDSTTTIQNDLTTNSLNEGETTTNTPTTIDNNTFSSIQTTDFYEITTDSETNFITMKTILNSTDCTHGSDPKPPLSNLIENFTTIFPVDANEINKLNENNNNEDLTTTSIDEEYYTDSTTEETSSELKILSEATQRSSLQHKVRLESKSNGSNDYEYDYNNPTLPPSLPNLRIIPFVAADALDTKESNKDKLIYAQDRVQSEDFSYNGFSPPMETEGGFIPKEPPLLESFYENAVTTPMTLLPNLNNIGNCLVDQQELIHGQSTPSKSLCEKCTCFYGTIVCKKVVCDLPQPGCRKSTVQDLSLCCSQYICDDKESPTVVLDRIESVNSTQMITDPNGIITPDPFRDVIRTEPAPNLQSLIVDMLPHLAKQSTTTPIPSTIPPTTLNTTSDSLSFDKVLELLFSGNTEELLEATTTTTKNSQLSSQHPVSTSIPLPQEPSENQSWTTPINEIKIETTTPSSADSGILKLAGCNIYGKMYRVGRIISELSGPCLECKCTEIGVQCLDLKC